MEPIDRNTLVDTVKHSGKVQIRRQPQRRETEAAHAQAAERLGVCARRQAVRDHPRVRVLADQCAGHGVVQVTVGARFHRYVLVDELAGHVRAEHLVELGQELFLISRQETPVDFRSSGLRHDIDFITGAQNCRIYRIPQRRGI